MKRDVVMVTVSANSMKTAFRKSFPDKGATELYPIWQRFWASIVLAAKVEKVPAPQDEPVQDEKEL